MANYKKGKSKRKGSACRMCKPWKRTGIGDRSGWWPKSRILLEQKIKEAMKECA